MKKKKKSRRLATQNLIFEVIFERLNCSENKFTLETLRELSAMASTLKKLNTI